MGTKTMIILTVLGALAFTLFLGFLGIMPFANLTTALTSFIGKFSMPDLSINAWAGFATIGGTITTAVAGIAKWIQTKKQLVQTQTQAAQTATAYDEELKNYSGIVTTQQKELDALVTEKANLQTQVEEANKAKTAAEESVLQLEQYKVKADEQINALTDISARAKVLADGKAVEKIIVR